MVIRAFDRVEELYAGIASGDAGYIVISMKMKTEV